MAKDYFVHFRAIQNADFKTLPEAAHVRFKVGKGQKGLQAEEVELNKQPRGKPTGYFNV